MYEDFFSERLAELREQKNVSAREMSLAIGQNESYINRIENKKAYPSMQCFFYICEYLDITPKDFFSEELSCPKEIHEITELLYELTPAQLTLISELLRELQK